MCNEKEKAKLSIETKRELWHLAIANYLISYYSFPYYVELHKYTMNNLIEMNLTSGDQNSERHTDTRWSRFILTQISTQISAQISYTPKRAIIFPQHPTQILMTLQNPSQCTPFSRFSSSSSSLKSTAIGCCLNCIGEKMGASKWLQRLSDLSHTIL